MINVFYMLIDMHVHTDISPCSVLTLEEIIRHAPQRGLDAVCLTDHDTMEAEEKLKSIGSVNGLKLFVGMEYATAQGDYLVFGDFRDLKTGLGASELFDIVNERKGAIISAHPFRRGRSADTSTLIHKHFEVVEAVNGRNSLDENIMAQAFARDNGLAMSAGSDAHTLEELGQCPTRFIHPVNSVEDLILAINSRGFTTA